MFSRFVDKVFYFMNSAVTTSSCEHTKNYSGLKFLPYRINSIEIGKMLFFKLYFSVENLIKTPRRLKIKMTGLFVVLFGVKLNNLVLRMLRVFLKIPNHHYGAKGEFLFTICLLISIGASFSCQECHL